MILLLEIVALGFILLLTIWVAAPVGVLAGFGLVALALAVRSRMPRSANSWLETGSWTAVAVGSVVMAASGAVAGLPVDAYYSGPAAVMAGAIWLAAWRVGGKVWRGRWNALVMVWLLAAAFLWMGGGYFQNQRGVFFGGLLALLAAFLLCRCWFRWGFVGGQILNTCILLLLALPLVDGVMRPQSRMAVTPENCQLYYSFDAAKGDPDAFGRWQDFYDAAGGRMGHEIYLPATNSALPFHLKPNSHSIMISCPVSINSLGFRGPEISLAKHGVYRIVALGESTTFGMTIRAHDSPWPEKLEQIIRQRLPTSRPVQVVNAGVPSYTVNNNLSRLPGEILALQPDMIISYHGANGFFLLDHGILPPTGPVPPVYRERPIKLAADVEHRLRMLFFRRRALRSLATSAAPAAAPLLTSYAAAYRHFIEFAHTNHIRLAIANYSMAINGTSDPRVVDFYQGGGPRSAHSFLRANPIHSLIVRQVAAEHPDVCFVDTHPHLDGEHEKFIDLIHLTDAGRQQLAENMFAAIRPVLEADLMPPGRTN